MAATFTRRQWLRLGAGALLSLGVWPGRLRGEDAPAHGDFDFIAVNDLHALEPACRPWFDKVVRQMKASAPNAECCLLGGDLADNGTPAQLTTIKEAFSALGIPCHAVVGNHDYLSDTDRSAYEQIFPGQINYTFDQRGWQIIAVSTPVKEPRQRTPASRLPPLAGSMKIFAGSIRSDPPSSLPISRSETLSGHDR